MDNTPNPTPQSARTTPAGPPQPHVAVAADPKEQAGRGGIGSRVPAKQRVIFSRQMSTLINAGLPLVQGLSTVQIQTTNKTLKLIISDIIRDVEAGSSLANSLAKYPKVFDKVYVSLVAAGEASGTLDRSMERLATQQEKDSEIVSRVRGALMYPAIVLVVLFAVMIFMTVAVIPQVQNLYNSLPDAKLPLITTILISFSHAFTKLWWLVVLIVIGIVFGARQWISKPAGRETMDSLKMRVWPAGVLMMKLYMARFARTASTLIGAGVPMIQALDTTADAVGNTHLSKAINKAAEQVKGGKSLSASLTGDPNFLPLVPGMINVGEESGALDEMLGRVADYYEKEVDNEIRTISSVIEPVMMIAVGIIALIIVAAVLLPIYSLAGKNFGNI